MVMNITLKDDDSNEKVYASYNETGILLTSVTIGTGQQVLFFIPYDQFETLAYNKVKYEVEQVALQEEEEPNEDN